MRVVSFVAAVSVATLLGAASARTASSPVPSPSPSGSSDTRGVNVAPIPNSPYKAKGHEYVALGVQRPGTVLADTLVLLNPTDHPQTVYVYGADGYPAIGGGYGYTLRQQRVSRIGAWVQLPVSMATVPATATLRIRWSLRIPSDAAGGRYIGAIVAEPAGQAVPTQFSAVTRFAMAITLTVPGGAPNATPGLGRPDGRLRLNTLRLKVAGHQLCPMVSYSNDSQDVVNPIGTVTVDGALTHRRSRRLANLGAVAPEQTVTEQLPCVQRPLGPGRVTVTLASPHGDATRAVESFWLPSPLVVSLLLLLLIAAALVTTYVRSTRRRRRAGTSAS